LSLFFHINIILKSQVHKRVEFMQLTFKKFFLSFFYLLTCVYTVLPHPLFLVEPVLPSVL
jgi:hypothetical protein